MYEELINRLTVCEDDCSRCPMMYDEQVEQDLVREHCAAYEAADAIENTSKAYQIMAEAYEAEVTKKYWIPVTFEDGGLTASIPDEYDGCWIIVTDGESISVERFKKDAYDHFFPSGRWFELDDVTHWMPLPTPPKEET